MPISLRSFSKINLGLAVGPARADGFHELLTCYQTLALHDVVTVTARRAPATAVRVNATHPGVPRTETGDAERNTAWKIVTGALDRMGLTAEVEIDIEKRLPVQGGLGAGSANAAAALLGLERELGVSLRGDERLELAAAVGSDVPLFLLGGTVLGRGRGEEVYPLPDVGSLPCVVAVPAVGVSTGRAFRDLDERMGHHARKELLSTLPLTDGENEDRLKKLSRALSSTWTPSGFEKLDGEGEIEFCLTGIASFHRPEQASGSFSQEKVSLQGEVGSDLAEKALLALVRTGIENDFEEVVFSQHPPLRSTKRDLMGSGPGSAGGALYAALSGSGSALFGLYRSLGDAHAAQQRVQASGTQAIVTHTLARPEYWGAMFSRAGSRKVVLPASES